MKYQIENKNGINVVSSRVIANELGKQHKHVLESIEKLISDSTAEISALFIQSTYVASNGKTNKEYLLTKDGFTLYMFNIQGHNDFKMAYINEFNRMEQHIRQLQNLSPANQLLAHAQVLVEMESRLNDQDASIRRLEHNQRRLSNSNYVTVIAYANMNGIHPSTYNASVIGRRAKALCVERAILTGTIVDSRYGHINTYPSEILDEVFFKNKEVS